MFIDCPSVCGYVLTCVVRASLPGRRHSPVGFPSRGGSRGVTRVTSHPLARQLFHVIIMRVT